MLWPSSSIARNGARNLVQRARPLIATLALALLFGAPWFVRNAQTYGHLDILAWSRHDAVVSGQLRTADLLRQIGLPRLLQRFALTTFHSFWAQFGWMGVLVDQRLYLALGLFSALLGLGLLMALLRAVRARMGVPPNRSQGHGDSQKGWALVGLSAALTVSLYLAYNLKFVQHQGRYLFTALGPLALGAGLGLQELLQPRTAKAMAVALLALCLLVFASGVLRGDLPRWNLGLLILSAAWLASAGWLPQRWRWLAPASLYVALLCVDFICLYGYIVPALR
jgi:hypothetical protein